MSPKKAASKSKGQEGDAMESTERDGWKPSKCNDFHLHGLVKEGLLQPREKVHWRRAIGDVPPCEESQEIISFHPFVLLGFAIPTSDFFRGLLHYWGVQVHHLTPNFHPSHLHLCPSLEAYLGIGPHFDLFRLLFHLKP